MTKAIPGLIGADTTNLKNVQKGLRKVGDNTASDLKSDLKKVNPRLDANHNTHKQDSVLDNGSSGTSKVANVRNLFQSGQMKIAMQPPGGKPSAIQTPGGRPQAGYKAQVSQDSNRSDSDHSGSGIIGSQPPVTNTRQKRQRAALPAPPSTNDTPQPARTASPAQSTGTGGRNRQRKQSAGTVQERPLPSLPPHADSPATTPQSKVLPPPPPSNNTPRAPIHSPATPVLPARGERPLPPTPGNQQGAPAAGAQQGVLPGGVIIPPRNPELANRPLPPPPVVEEMVSGRFITFIFTQKILQHSRLY